jgi:hypothetical protein
MTTYSEAVDAWLDHLEECKFCHPGVPVCVEGSVLNELANKANFSERG